jgi:transcriptional regulator with XRE-family HTH domain
MPKLGQMEDWFDREGRAALKRAGRIDGLNQVELASRLGITQSHLSKLLTGKKNPSEALERKIRLHLSKRHREGLERMPDWAADSIELAQVSPEFRDLLLAALRLFRA